ncbi:hypothetical protein Tco_0840338 [Tanacetum coccineum]|uniref:Uncharacterized protein n=1 Tax=Tanacetum coccineum TaxID=301880 RepID=A0ABQ5AUF1_9ASTR
MWILRPKEFGHFAKECRKPKQVKDSTYHKEKMLLCKQAEKGVQLQAEHLDRLATTEKRLMNKSWKHITATWQRSRRFLMKTQELILSHWNRYNTILKIMYLPMKYNILSNLNPYSNNMSSGTGDINVIPDSPDMCDNDIQDDQNDVECDDERVALANLIANLKLDVDENKKIQKQLKKANATLTQELTECKSILAETSRTLGESNSIQDSCLVALQNKQTEFERFKAFNDRTVDYDKLERRLNETLGLLAQKEKRT